MELTSPWHLVTVPFDIISAVSDPVILKLPLSAEAAGPTGESRPAPPFLQSGGFWAAVRGGGLKLRLHHTFMAPRECQSSEQMGTHVLIGHLCQRHL